jgi:4'-phosphopantetheinyl transferase
MNEGSVVEANSVTVWTMTLDDIPASQWSQLYALLGTEERERAARFAFERHRRQYTAAHALKRLMLTAARQGSRQPADWSFETCTNGKPRVSGAVGPYFNLSHCDGLVACAVSLAADIGVDVERLDRQPPRYLLDSRFLAPAEHAWLQGLPDALHSIGFFRLWTLKEACIKATGMGLTVPLDTIAFSFDPLLVTFSDPVLGDTAQWSFEQKIINSGRHVLAAAWRQPAARLGFKLEAVRPEVLLSLPQLRAFQFEQ